VGKQAYKALGVSFGDVTHLFAPQRTLLTI